MSNQKGIIHFFTSSVWFCLDRLTPSEEMKMREKVSWLGNVLSIYMLVFEACELEYVFKLYAYKNECILLPVALFRYWFVLCITPRPFQ